MEGLSICGLTTAEPPVVLQACSLDRKASPSSSAFWEMKRGKKKTSSLSSFHTFRQPKRKISLLPAISERSGTSPFFFIATCDTEYEEVTVASSTRVGNL